MSQKNKYQDPGPNPDPMRYILVKTREGSFYRLKRGLRTKAHLNEAFKKSAENSKLTSPAARRMVARLRDHLQGLSTGRITARFGGMLKKSLHQKSGIDFSFFEGYDLQDSHPLSQLYSAGFQTDVNEASIDISIPIFPNCVRQYSRLVTHYYFDAVLLWGDPTKDNGLRVDSVSSSLYSIETVKKTNCVISIPLPAGRNPWLLLLKLSCLEGNELAASSRNYGMKVLNTGGEKVVAKGK